MDLATYLWGIMQYKEGVCVVGILEKKLLLEVYAPNVGKGWSAALLVSSVRTLETLELGQIAQLV
jgi:hypothetical protein